MIEMLRISQQAATLWIMNPWKRGLGNWISYPWWLVGTAGLKISWRIKGTGTYRCRRTRCWRQVQQEVDDNGDQHHAATSCQVEARRAERSTGETEI